MGQHRQEFVLEPVGFLRFEEQARVLEGDRRPGRDTDSQSLVLGREHVATRMTEEQTAQYFLVTRLHWNGKVAAHVRWPAGMPKYGALCP